MDLILTTNVLTKQYGRQRAVDSVSVEVRKGDIYGLIGRNGAGKTTFIRMAAGFAAPTSGSITFFTGEKPTPPRIGTLIEAPGIYPNMTAYENLKTKCLCLGIDKKGYIEEKLELVGLSAAGKKNASNFSLGMKQRLGIALALIGEPELLLLDEPINGLDPQGIVDVREILVKLNREHNITIVVSSHILEELSKIATIYGFISSGRLVEQLTKEQLQKNCGERIEIVLEQPEAAVSALSELGITNYKIIDENTIHIFDRLDMTPEIVFALAARKIRVHSIGVMNRSLESYFLEITGGAVV